MENHFQQFLETIAKLRDPKDGCPWDLEQNHKTLLPYLEEECKELAEAIKDFYDQPSVKTILHFKEELGDLLLQIVLHAQLASEAGHFNMQDVIAGIQSKMLMRHPHVFEKHQESNHRPTKTELKKQWLSIKQVEKNLKVLEEHFYKDSHKSALDQAESIGKFAEEFNFDWSNPIAVTQQMISELTELQETLINCADNSSVEDELGDCFFSLVQVTRHLQKSPHNMAIRGNKKFTKRFIQATKIYLLQNSDRTLEDWKDLSLEKKHTYWKLAKDQEERAF